MVPPTGGSGRSAKHYREPQDVLAIFQKLDVPCRPWLALCQKGGHYAAAPFPVCPPRPALEPNPGTRQDQRGVAFSMLCCPTGDAGG